MLGRLVAVPLAVGPISFDIGGFRRALGQTQIRATLPSWILWPMSSETAAASPATSQYLDPGGSVLDDKGGPMKLAASKANRLNRFAILDVPIRIIPDSYVNIVFYSNVEYWPIFQPILLILKALIFYPVDLPRCADFGHRSSANRRPEVRRRR